MSDFRICVQNLASYNNGKNEFQWLDLPMSEESLADICATIAHAPRDADGTVTGEGDEIIVADVEGFPWKAEAGTPAQYAAWVETLEEHGEPLAAYVEWLGVSLSDDPQATAIDFEEAYNGEFDSKEAHAEATFRDCTDIPQHLENYIDWEKVARDFSIGGDFYYAENGYHTVYVFRSV